MRLDVSEAKFVSGKGTCYFVLRGDDIIRI